LGFGILFIVLGLFFTGKGWIPPILAVVLHLVASLIVVFNSARLVRFGEELTPHVETETVSTAPEPSAAYNTGDSAVSPA
jgi:Cd2+/Zn2+-exporting ATPase